MGLSTKRAILAVTIAAAFMISAPAQVVVADDAVAAGRDIMARHSNAVVTIYLVMKMQMSMGGQASPKEEMRIEVNGATIDPSGLTVASLSDLSPEDVMSKMGWGEDQGIKLNVETTDVKIRLATGQEIPAKIVLRDKDLDLAFIRPAQKLATPAPAIDLSDSARLNVLDPVITIGRLGKVASRAACARLDHIQAVIEKPRTFYVPCSDAAERSLGMPVFALDGKIAGLMVVRMTSAGKTSGYGFMQSGSDNMLAVTLPAEDVLEIAKQAPEQAAEERSAPEAKPADSKKPAPELSE